MASWLVKRIFCITCLAVVSYAFPRSDENGTASYVKKIGYVEESTDQETMDIRDHEFVLAAINDSEEFSGLSETGELNNGTAKMMNASSCDVKNKTGHCVRNKRSTGTGNDYWKLHNHAIPGGYSKTISTDWDGLEGPLDASYTNTRGETYFFKGSQYWKFVNKEKQNGYPKQISAEFRGIPDGVDAVFSVKNTQQTYFFKGKKYWLLDRRLEPPVHQDYPKRINETWGHLLRNGIDAAFQWQDKRVYFFREDKYYQYNLETFRVVENDPPYPRPSGSIWFGCP